MIRRTLPGTFPVLSTDKDRLLQQALEKLDASPAPLAAMGDPIVTAAHRLPAVQASFAPYPEGTDERLRAALATRGIGQLYTHQAEAFGHILAGRNVVTITPTASGKTVCYNAPVLNAILQDPTARALYLFPTKALAQDQLAELHTLSEGVASACGPRAPSTQLRVVLSSSKDEAPEGSADGAAERERVGVGPHAH